MSQNIADNNALSSGFQDRIREITNRNNDLREKQFENLNTKLMEDKGMADVDMITDAVKTAQNIGGGILTAREILKNKKQRVEDKIEGQARRRRNIARNERRNKNKRDGTDDFVSDDEDEKVERDDDGNIQPAQKKGGGERNVTKPEEQESEPDDEPAEPGSSEPSEPSDTRPRDTSSGGENQGGSETRQPSPVESEAPTESSGGTASDISGRGGTTSDNAGRQRPASEPPVESEPQESSGVRSQSAPPELPEQEEPEDPEISEITGGRPQRGIATQEAPDEPRVLRGMPDTDDTFVGGTADEYRQGIVETQYANPVEAPRPRALPDVVENMYPGENRVPANPIYDDGSAGRRMGQPGSAFSQPTRPLEAGGENEMGIDGGASRPPSAISQSQFSDISIDRTGLTPSSEISDSDTSNFFGRTPTPEVSDPDIYSIRPTITGVTQQPSAFTNVRPDSVPLSEGSVENPQALRPSSAASRIQLGGVDDPDLSEIHNEGTTSYMGVENTAFGEYNPQYSINADRGSWINNEELNRGGRSSALRQQGIDARGRLDAISGGDEDEDDEIAGLTGGDDDADTFSQYAPTTSSEASGVNNIDGDPSEVSEGSERPATASDLSSDVSMTESQQNAAGVGAFDEDEDSEISGITGGEDSTSGGGTSVSDSFTDSISDNNTNADISELSSDTGRSGASPVSEADTQLTTGDNNPLGPGGDEPDVPDRPRLPARQSIGNAETPATSGNDLPQERVGSDGAADGGSTTPGHGAIQDVKEVGGDVGDVAEGEGKSAFRQGAEKFAGKIASGMAKWGGVAMAGASLGEQGYSEYEAIKNGHGSLWNRMEGDNAAAKIGDAGSMIGAAMETAGGVLDATGIGAEVGVALGIGGAVVTGVSSLVTDVGDWLDDKKKVDTDKEAIAKPPTPSGTVDAPTFQATPSVAQGSISQQRVTSGSQ